MAQISKHTMNARVQKDIQAQTLHLFFASNRKTSSSLFGELLTDTEQLMLAKRLVTLLMLEDEQSYYRIKQVLGVSVSTSKRLHTLLINGAFPTLENITANKRARDKTMTEVGKLLRAGLPPRSYVIKKRRDCS